MYESLKGREVMGHFEYKGIRTVIEWDWEDLLYYGTFRNDGDTVDFMASTLDGAISEFRMAVDDYYQYCHNIGKELSVKAITILD